MIHSIRRPFRFVPTALLASLAGFASIVSAQPTSEPATPTTRPTATSWLPDRQSATLRLPNMPLHDPFIVAHEPTRTYYLYTTNDARMTGDRRPGTMVYRSTDLLNWSRPTVVFHVPEGTWADPTERPWAPEVHEYRGKFYLFTTLHNAKRSLFEPPEVPYATSARSTIIAVSDTPDGPFTVLSNGGPWAPADFMVLDGTLFLDDRSKPWMVYAHEWVQKVDGTMEAIPLSDDLAKPIGDPIHLFSASEGPWLHADRVARGPTTRATNYVTDGPQFFRSKAGSLLMLWSSYDNDGYVQTVARSRSGTLTGPWEQHEPLLRQDSGHGMLFRTFEGQLMLIVHRPFNNARGKLYDVEDAGDHLRIVRQRVELDGGDAPTTRPASPRD